MDAWREKHVRRARTYSARHHCQVRVEHVVKGRGKGRYETVVEGNNACWWPSSVVEVIAVYYDGQEIQNHGKVVIPSRSNPMVGGWLGNTEVMISRPKDALTPSRRRAKTENRHRVRPSSRAR
jgi:hypothetical protein